MDTNQNKPTVGERFVGKDILGECVTFFDEGISWQAKMGMRAYTPKELEIYKNILAGVKLVEDKGIDVHRGFGPWDLYAPTKHRSIDALKPFDSTGDELEVWNGVYGRIIRNEYSVDDEDYMKEIEKRTNGETSLVKIRQENKSLVEKYESLKKEKVGIELKTENELAKIQIKLDTDLKALSDMQEKTEKIAEEREKNKKKGFLSRLFEK